MKKVTNHFIAAIVSILGFTLSVTTPVFGQSYQEEVDMYQAIFGMEKKAMVLGFMDNEDDTAFWMIYDEYESERKILGKKRLDLLADYVNNYEDMTDEKAEELMKQIMKQKKSLDKLIDKYYKKTKKTSGVKDAAQFYQIENYILSAIRLQILDSIPFIGELD